MSFAIKLLPILVVTAGPALFAQSTISCKSDDMRRHYCAADTRGGVTLARQRSDAACIQGRTWGYDRNGVWVDRGCRAEFAVGTGYYGNNGAYGRGGYDPYGYGRNDPYAYGRNDPYYGNGGYSSTVHCSSDDMRRHYCAADTRGGVALARQRSDASCIQGRTWGYDRNGIWVDRGCRADFALNTGTYGNGSYRNGGYDRDRRRNDRDYERERRARDRSRRWPW
jgi:hypothetical protein